MDNEDEQSEFQ